LIVIFALNFGQQPIISCQFFEWLKFIELLMAMVMDNIKDDEFFSNLSLKDSKFTNQLTMQLELFLRMFA
jgi:hypothetical protein